MTQTTQRTQNTLLYAFAQGKNEKPAPDDEAIACYPELAGVVKTSW